ncbi:hypothetical protein AB0M19_12880 [Streptomyces sp. NPDC051920]|uniref:SCO2400 family protein n=1 Tax=Streptomyces sp. NPDC051920 TaxID=3155523 RepID=UPI0034242010
MDYCHVCRRHLNGALACPGCGTPVDELGADAEGAGARPPTGADAGADARHGEGGDVEWRSRRAERRRGGPVLDAETDGPGDPRGTRAPAGASRRDRKAAAHRRRRRRTLYIAVGFVLASGGLSLAELGVDAPGLGPSPAAAESPDGSASPAASLLNKDSASKSPSAGRTSSSPSASTSGSASASASATATSDESAGSGESPTAGTLPGRTPSATATAAPAPATSAPAGTDPTTSAPTPGPSSSDDCNRFLWWCT